MYIVLRKKGDGVDTRHPNQDDKKSPRKGKTSSSKRRTYVVLTKMIKTP